MVTNAITRQVESLGFVKGGRPAARRAARHPAPGQRPAFLSALSCSLSAFSWTVSDLMFATAAAMSALSLALAAAAFDFRVWTADATAALSVASALALPLSCFCWALAAAIAAWSVARWVVAACLSAAIVLLRVDLAVAMAAVSTWMFNRSC